MDEDRLRSVWRQDEALLARIGGALAPQETDVEVRLPRELADAAVRAWQRTDDDASDLDGETCEQRVVRQRAGALALIGAALEDRGREDGDEVVVRLAAWFVGDTLNAADDQNLI
jgi:hypothetical protein